MRSLQTQSLTALFITSSIIWISGNGLIPLLPVFAETLGANNLQIGLYLAFSYTCLAIGALHAARFIGKSRTAKSILIVTGAISVPLTFCVGQANSIVDLMLFTAIIWLLGGAGFSAMNALTARFTTHQNRGKVMGTLAITSPLGSVLGGLISGPIVDQWGFDALFLTLAFINLLWPISGMFIRLNVSTSSESHSTLSESHPSNTAPITHLNGNLPKQQWNYRLITATMLSYVTYYIALLATSLAMKDAGFSATAISSTGILGGLASIPFVYGVSRISDAIGRKPLWVVCNLVGIISLIILAFAQTLMHFWLVAILIRFLSSGGRGISNAWAVDIAQAHKADPTQSAELPTRGLSSDNQKPAFNEEKMLALLSATIWIGGVLGYLLYGSSTLWLDHSMTLLISTLIPALSILLILPIHLSSAAQDKSNLSEARSDQSQHT